MGFSCGIIGLPNVGKSTIFNALTSAKAASANFPFCTIEPNTGAVPLPDQRLQVLAKISGSAQILPTQITFVDIAGLIKGASQGQGLGNQFLAHIRAVDAVAHVVRCFEDEQIIHVEGSVDPLRDIETIDTELVLADMEMAERMLHKLRSNAKSGNKDAVARASAGENVLKHLEQGKALRTIPNLAEGNLIDLGNFLTYKPILLVANVCEADLKVAPDPSASRAVDRLKAYALAHKLDMVVISGQVEAELAELSADERQQYLHELGTDQCGLDRLALAGYKLLDLITFFTTGPKETHAWTAQAGSTAPQCAGKIHTDFEKGFIRAEVISYQDFVQAGGEHKARELGKLRVEGKEYIVCDGDIVHFRFNV